MRQLKETWLFLNSGACSPAYNMACDEALLNWQSEGKIPPVIRFYSWDPATLSIGYFQRAKKEINLDAVKGYGLGFVRRPTGGRAVLHEYELTYSVIVSEEHPKMPKSVTEAYRVISEGVLQGFRELGLDAYFSVPRSEEEKMDLKKPKSSVCFDAPSWYELVVEGRKVAGSAQTRQKGVILQHGAILLDLDEDKMFDLFNFRDLAEREKMQANFKNKAVTINQLLGRKISLEQAVAAFKTGFEKGLNVELQEFVLDEPQKNEIQEIARNRYQSDDWNFMR
ncbi:octanoyltransferase [Pueribacillus theae]|uniref:Octanoyltransferase LipM n=1 Tax=Pueribacillus theae TaxID=2171751 RepID=A0A2U1K737_9BACI|nr:biotin/lipoate A/B protein ligase family protein [Pueribacillus theae]PWA13347.1 octanoyltransferase [Pueribacillus theae]